MKLTRSTFLICLIPALASPIFAQEHKPVPPLPAAVAALVDGAPISQADYQDFLYQSFGKRPLHELIDQRLVTAASKSYGIEIPEADQRAIFEERLLQAHQGRSEEQFLISLGDGGLSLELFSSNLHLKILQELTLDALVRQTRVPTDVRLNKAFEAKYGAGGIKVEVSHVLVMPHFLRANLIRAGADARSIDNAQMKLDAERIAGECHAKLVAGADFKAMVAEYSHDQVSLRTEGMLPSYRPGLYGPAFTHAVASLKPGEFSEVIESGAGFHVVQLVSRQVTKMEDVRLALTEQVMTAAPTWQEREEVLSSLRAAAEIQLW